MTGTVIASCGYEGLVGSFLQTQGLDRYRISCGVWDRSVQRQQHMCKRLVNRESVLHRRAQYRHVCNSAEPDWDAEMSLFRKRTMKPNQMETVRRLEEEVDIGKVRGQVTPSVRALVWKVLLCWSGVVFGGWLGYSGGVEQRRPCWCISPLCKWSFGVGARKNYARVYVYGYLCKSTHL